MYGHVAFTSTTEMHLCVCFLFSPCPLVSLYLARLVQVGDKGVFPGKAEGEYIFSACLSGTCSSQHQSP